MSRLHAAVAGCLLAAPAAGANAALYQAISAHQQGHFAASRDALARLASDASLSEDDRVTAEEYLASCQLQLKEREEAKAVLKGLLRQHPDAHLDPELFFPELIALAEQARIELAAEVRGKISEPEPPPPAPAPVAVASTPATSGGGLRGYAKFPLIGGAVLVVGAAVLEGLAYSQWSTLEGSAPLKNNDPSPYRNTGTAEQTAAQVTGALGAAALLAGGALLLFGKPDEVTVAPSIGGFQVAGRF